MSITTESAIWQALRSRVESLPMPYSKAWPGETFEVPHANGLPQPFLRIGRVSVAPVRQLIAPGKPHQRTGSLIVTLCVPVNYWKRVDPSDQTAGAIADHFRDGTQMAFGGVCVSVTDYPHVGEGYLEGAYWETTVRIPWRCFA